MRIVIVSQGIQKDANNGVLRDHLDHTLIHFLTETGFLPIPLPNSLGDLLLPWLAQFNQFSILLSGGNDYGMFPQRDSTELMLLDYAAARRIPVLGICRGMQVLALHAGVGLHKVDGHVCTRHQLSGCFGFNVNSYHHFSINKCPPGYSVTSTSPDMEIESIKHLYLPWQGWMWHPERDPLTTQVIQLLQGFLR